MVIVEVKTSDLIGISLDWAVAKACGMMPVTDHKVCRIIGFYLNNPPAHIPMSGHPFSPSNQWRDGGPLIDEFRFCFDNAGEHGFSVVKDWYCGEPIAFYPHGKTHLIAACRAIVAAKIGDTVSVPKELMQ